MFICRWIFVILFSWAALPQVASRAEEPKKPDRTNKVTIVIDYGDGVEKHFTAISWKKGMTVLAGMQAAQAHPRGIRFEHRGQGATALLTKIDDLANEGKQRNWLYRVNGKLANQSFGVQEMQAGDTVLWRFE